MLTHSVVSNSVTPWTVAHQAPLSMEFSWQEYWSGLPCPSPGYLSNPGIKLRSPALQADSLPSELRGSLITAAIALIYAGVIAVPHPVLNHMLFHLILVTHVDIN